MTRVSPQDELTSEGRTTRVRLLRWAHDLLAILVLLGFVAFLWERRAHLASLLETSVLQLCALAATVVLTWVVVAAQSFLLYRASGVAVGFGECVVLAVGGAFGNYLPMRLGTVVRARYLKVVHGLRYARFGSIFGVRTLLTVAATGALGLIGTVGVALGGGRLSPELLVVFGLLVLVPWLAWRAPLPSRSEDAGRGRRILNDLVDGARTLRQQPATNLLVLALIVLQQVTFALRFGLVLIAADQEPSVPVVLLLAALALLTSYLSVTPGGLGVREAVMGYATLAAGSSFTTGLYVGTVDRAVELVMVAVFGGAGFAFIWWKSRQADSRPSLP